jgi:hypothetical protein
VQSEKRDTKAETEPIETANEKLAKTTRTLRAEIQMNQSTLMGGATNKPRPKRLRKMPH